MVYKVIQYASGTTGRLALRTLAERADMQLVGLGVTGKGKVGMDAGEIAGSKVATGILATDDIDALCALDADVVLHMPLPSWLMRDGPQYDEEVIRRFLASGKNVITTVGYTYPKAYGAKAVARLEAACAKGNSSLHGTGFNPGFVSDVVPVTLLSMSARVERVMQQDISDFSTHPAESFVKGYLGFDATPEEFAARTAFRDYSNGLFGESMMMLADCLGVTTERVENTLETHVATEDIAIACGTIRKGCVSAFYSRWQGIVDGRPLIDLRLIYRTRNDQGAQWGQGKPFVFEIDGRPKFKVELEHDWISSGLWGTAGHAVNAIPHVVAAAPGIRTFLDLPMIRATGAVRFGT